MGQLEANKLELLVRYQFELDGRSLDERVAINFFSKSG